MQKIKVKGQLVQKIERVYRAAKSIMLLSWLAVAGDSLARHAHCLAARSGLWAGERHWHLGFRQSPKLTCLYFNLLLVVNVKVPGSTCITHQILKSSVMSSYGKTYISMIFW